MTTWRCDPGAVAFEPSDIAVALGDLAQPCAVVRIGDRVGVARGGEIDDGGVELLAWTGPLAPSQLGDPAYRAAHRVRLAYAAGPMANGIASEDLVCAMGRAGLLATFGAAGLVPSRIERAIDRIQTELAGASYAFNLIHSPNEDTIERGTVELYLDREVRTVEASAFLDLTPHIVRYRVSGLSLQPDGTIERANRVIAKISRRELARKFLEPAPTRILGDLLAARLIDERQAALAARVPMCDDITVEADSGGHTDNRPLVCLLPSILELRDEIQAEQKYAEPPRVGAAGGIGTPSAALAAFQMGAAYVVTGSVNQSCLEAGTSAHSKALLAEADLADVMMAPAADMFEMGVKVQLLKRGTLFPVRAQRLYELYRDFDGIEALPASERDRLERQLFRRGLDDVWQETVAYFQQRDPSQIERVAGNPRRKMALIFRWYLGLSSRWSNTGEPGREFDYQIWCGPAMGAFNDWVRGSYLEPPANRRVVDVAENLMRGAAYLYRVQALKIQGWADAGRFARYQPMPLDSEGRHRSTDSRRSPDSR